ncbi:MAG: hypothetical protein SFU86_13070 [Pirellulaceae bacterium]|nr:hypothetical protein [Pirellulaceae bacterium]
MAKKKSKKHDGAKRDTPITAPSRPTVKRLFAVSGNRCAFNRCTTAIVDTQSGSVLGEICHIRGEKPTAKRYDSRQTAAQRHGFDNLILLCPTHHTIIDDDDRTYTVDLLTQMNARHEARQRRQNVSDQLANKLIMRFSSYTVHQGSLIRSEGQAGGQVAHSIKNIYHAPVATDDRVLLEGKVGPLGDLKTINRFGTPGVQLTVVNRGTRPAKIARAQFCVEGKGFLAAFEKGFGHKLNHDPPPGHEIEILHATLYPRAKKHCPDGFVLQRDDVLRFFLPFGPYIGPALKAKQDAVYFRIVFFDGSREILVRGKEAKDIVRDSVKAYEGWPHNPRRTGVIGVEVISKVPPKFDFDALGKRNPNAVWFGKPGTQPKPPKPAKLAVELGLAGIKDQWTIIATIGRLPLGAADQLKLKFCVVDHGKKVVHVLELNRVEVGKKAGKGFVIPMEHRDKARRVVETFSAELFWLSIFVGDVEIVRVTGEELKVVFRALEEHLKKVGQSGQSAAGH